MKEIILSSNIQPLIEEYCNIKILHNKLFFDNSIKKEDKKEQLSDYSNSAYTIFEEIINNIFYLDGLSIILNSNDFIGKININKSNINCNKRTLMLYINVNEPKWTIGSHSGWYSINEIKLID